MKVLLPTRQKKSCQEMIGQYLMGCSMMKLWEFGLRVTGYRLRVAGCGLRVQRFKVQRFRVKRFRVKRFRVKRLIIKNNIKTQGKVKGNPLSPS